MRNAEFVIFLDKAHQMLYPVRSKTVCSLSKGVFFMRKILSLLLMLALFSPVRWRKRRRALTSR